MPVTALTIGQALYGAYQGYQGQKNASDAQSRMERLAKNSPLYTPSKGINDYYQEALNRYNQNPYQSAEYTNLRNEANRALAASVGAFQDRKGAIGGISRAQAITDANIRQAGVLAEQQRNARFGQYGQAAQMKAGEEGKAFDINRMTPFNRQFGLEQYKSQAGNELAQAGMQTLGNAASNAAQMYVANKYYNPKTPTTPVTQASANLGSQQAFDTSRSNLPTLDTIGRYNIPKTNALNYQPYIGDVSNPYIGNGRFRQSGYYPTLNYKLPSLRDYTNMQLPY